MTSRFEIDDLVWDAWNLSHIQKHQVTREEVQDAVRSIPIHKVSYRNRYPMIGYSATGAEPSGRLLRLQRPSSQPQGTTRVAGA